jgi:hypothetical protein
MAMSSGVNAAKSLCASRRASLQVRIAPADASDAEASNAAADISSPPLVPACGSSVG